MGENRQNEIRDLSDSQKNYGISLIRFISLVFIITCHIMQWLNCEFAWWFNVGVQIFLCISGYLYGKKKAEDITVFCLRRFKKILIPYYLTFIPYGILQFFFARDIFNWHNFIKGLFLNMTLKGAGHLWFVHTILMCYILIPLLSAFRDRFVKSEKSFLLFSLFSIGISALFFSYFNSFYTAAWIVCFIIGYVLGINEKNQYINERIGVVVIGISAAIGNAIQIYCSYIAQIQFARYDDFCNYNHVLLGVFLFLAMKIAFERINLSKIANLLSFTDYYSYEIYLTHHLVIMGPFSLMNITGNIWLNILVVLIVTIILAILIKKAVQLLRNLSYMKD